MNREELEKRKRMYQRWTRVSAEEAVELCDTALSLMDEKEKLEKERDGWHSLADTHMRDKCDQFVELTALRKENEILRRSRDGWKKDARVYAQSVGCAEEDLTALRERVKEVLDFQDVWPLLRENEKLKETVAEQRKWLKEERGRTLTANEQLTALRKCVTDKLQDELSARIREIHKFFASDDDPDTCKRCGLNIRNDVHFPPPEEK